MANEYDNTLLNRGIFGGSLLPVIVANMISYDQFTDCLDDAFVVLTHGQHEVHSGTFFVVDHVNLALAAAATMSLGATIPAGVFCHFRFIVSAGGAVHVELKEGVGFTGGAVETIYNANRNGPAAPFNAVSDATLAGGTVILEYVIAAGAGPKAAGGEGGLFEEFITKDEETYSIEVTNLTNGAIASSIITAFYAGSSGICP